MSASGVRKNAVPGMICTEEFRIDRTKLLSGIASLCSRAETRCVPRHQATMTRHRTAAIITGT